MSYNLLKGKKGIIFGALDENSIAWKTAERAHEEGAEFVLTNAPIAMRMGTIKDLAAKTGSQIIPADATSMEDLENLIEQSMEILGGKIDFVLHSIGMAVNVRKGKLYTDPKYDFTTKGWDVSAVSFHKVMNVLYNKEAMSEWGSIVALTYMARIRVLEIIEKYVTKGNEIAIEGKLTSRSYESKEGEKKYKNGFRCLQLQ